MFQFELGDGFFSIDVTVTRLTATEEELRRIFDSAFRGLTGDALALCSGFEPTQFKLLCESYELANRAVRYGKAMSQARLTGAMYDLAENSEDKVKIKAIMFLLTHSHDWKPAKALDDSSNETIITVLNGLPELDD